MKKIRSSKIVLLAVLLAVFVWFVNPSWIPFLGSEARLELTQTLNQAFSTGGGAGFGITLPRLITLAAVIAVTWAAYLLIRFLLGVLPWKSKRQVTVASLLASVCRYAAVLIGFFWGLSVLGVNTTAMFASVGLVALIVGFGAQSLIEDIITGVFIIFEGQYSVGDIIILDDFRGKVINIGVRTTVIEDAGGNLKIVNNSDIRNLQNRSQNLSLAVCDVSIAYEQELTAVETLLQTELPGLLERCPDIFREAPRYQGVQELAESAVVLRVTAMVDESDLFRAQRALNRELKLLFDRHHIAIPFPQVVVHRAD